MVTGSELEFTSLILTISQISRHFVIFGTQWGSITYLRCHLVHCIPIRHLPSITSNEKWTRVKIARINYAPIVTSYSDSTGSYLVSPVPLRIRWGPVHPISSPS